MLSFKLHMEFEPDTSVEATAVLQSLVGPVRAVPGCSMTRLRKGTGEGCEITWAEEWRSVDDFERHLRSSAFRQILAVIEMAAWPPVVEIDDVSSRRGFELVEEILSDTRLTVNENGSN